MTGLLLKRQKIDGEAYMARVREEMVLVAQVGSKSGTLFRSADKFIQNLMEVNRKTIGEMFEVCRENCRSETGKVFSADASIEKIQKELTEQKVILVDQEDTGTATEYVTLNDLVAAAPGTEISEISTSLPVISCESPVISLLRENFDRNGAVIRIVDHTEKYIGVAMVETLLLTALSFEESTEL